MRFLRNDTYLRRAVGTAILFALLGLWAFHWRDGIADQAFYDHDGYDAANQIAHALVGLSIACVVYVAVCLLATPSKQPAPDEVPAD